MHTWIDMYMHVHVHTYLYAFVCMIKAQARDAPSARGGHSCIHICIHTCIHMRIQKRDARSAFSGDIYVCIV